MRKISLLFVMIAGLGLASVNVNAQDAKSSSAPVKKEATSACCKSGDKASAGKCCNKGTSSACTNKDAGTTSQNVNDKAGASCKSKAETTASEAKSSKTVN